MPETPSLANHLALYDLVCQRICQIQSMDYINIIWNFSLSCPLQGPEY